MKQKRKRRTWPESSKVAWIARVYRRPGTSTIPEVLGDGPVPSSVHTWCHELFGKPLAEITDRDLSAAVELYGVESLVPPPVANAPPLPAPQPSKKGPAPSLRRPSVVEKIEWLSRVLDRPFGVTVEDWADEDSDRPCSSSLHRCANQFLGVPLRKATPRHAQEAMREALALEAKPASQTASRSRKQLDLAALDETPPQENAGGLNETPSPRGRKPPPASPTTSDQPDPGRGKASDNQGVVASTATRFDPAEVDVLDAGPMGMFVAAWSEDVLTLRKLAAGADRGMRQTLHQAIRLFATYRGVR